jgi:hypothetical protein
MVEFTGSRRYPRVKPPAGLLVAWQNANRKWLSYVGGLGLGEWASFRWGKMIGNG